ncbi:MAG: DMT family transporter [Gemmatimonadaceae bacterium]|nr:DMT family transporter [Gemmatimonadaceae bacterium]
MSSVTPVTTATPPARPAFSRTDAALLGVALVWGGNFAVVKHGAEQFAPFAFNAVRVGLATVLLFAAAAVAREARVPAATWRRLLALGLLGNGLYQILFVLAISRTRSANVAIMLAATPALLALVGRIRGTDVLAMRGIVGIGVSIAGLALVITGGAAGAAPGGSLGGDVLALLAVLCWVAYSVLLRPLTEQVPPISLSAITMLGGAVPLALVAIPQLSRVPWPSLPASAWGAVFYAGVLAIAIGYLAWYRGLRVLGPTRTAMYSNLQPVVALVVGALLLHEAPTPWQFLGAAGTMLGLLLVRS